MLETPAFIGGLLPQIDESKSFTPEEKEALTSWLTEIGNTYSSATFDDDSLFRLTDMVVSPPPNVTEILTTRRYDPLIDGIYKVLFAVEDAMTNVITEQERAQKTEEPTPVPGQDPQPFVGHHLLADFYGCKADLEDENLLKESISKAIEAADMEEIKTTLVHFEPFGITALAVLSQSGLGIHTWPESGNMMVDAVTCGPHDPSLIIDTLAEIYKPDRVDKKLIERGEGGDMDKKEEQDVAPMPVRYPDDETKIIEEGIEVKPCEHGHGAFATQDYEEGELIESFTGSFIEAPEEADKELAALRVGDLWWKEPKADGQEVWAIFLDHSDKPNATFDNFNFESGTGDLVALQSIKAGDELLINYGQYAPKNS